MLTKINLPDQTTFDPTTVAKPTVAKTPHGVELAPFVVPEFHGESEVNVDEIEARVANLPSEGQIETRTNEVKHEFEQSLQLKKDKLDTDVVAHLTQAESDYKTRLDTMIIDFKHDIDVKLQELDVFITERKQHHDN
jgi:hypothetical protein